MRVCLLPTDTWGVGSYRMLFPGMELEKHGHEVFLNLDEKTLEKRSKDSSVPLANAYSFKPDGTPEESFDADTYVFQHRMERSTPAAVRVLRHWNNRRVVVEIDDNYDNLIPGCPADITLKKHPDKMRLEWLNETIEHANLVTVSTPSLKEWYSQYNDNIQVLPNFLNWEMWENITPRYEHEGPIRVGWMGWLRWRGDDLKALKSFIRDWLLENPQVEFVSIGEVGRAKTVHDYLAIPRAQRRTVRAKSFHRLWEIVNTIDIGLVPLDLNIFNEGKSYLKGLEYSACGIVPVASPSQQYREFIDHGVDGFLASSPTEWREALDLLTRDDELRRQMGSRARQKASQMTIQKEWKRWEDAWLN